MAPFRNLFGEVSPDQMIVRVHVKTKDGVETIARVEAHNSKLQLEEVTLTDTLNQRVTRLAQVKNYVFPNIDAQPANHEAVVDVQRVPHEVVFMDVGRWGGPTTLAKRQRNFGLVWGTWAALCDFEATGVAIPTGEDFLRDEAGAVRPDHPINEFITKVRATGATIRVMRSMFSGNPNFLKGWVQDFETLYVILPDLHLPVLTKRPAPSDGHHMGRIEYRDNDSFNRKSDEGIVEGPPRRFGDGATRWFNNYLAGDIFGDGDGTAATELNQFLGIVEGMTLASNRQLHFVQVGDMYDMWIGLSRFFSKQPTQSVVLANGTGVNTGILAGKFIDFWADRTHLALQSTKAPNVVERMNRLAAHPRHKTSWLWGNHDNYLSAHTPQVSVGAPVPPRTRTVHKGGILIEHGQRGDPENRDGSVKGHDTTNDVFRLKELRSLDPNRRNFFTALAGATYVSNPNFHLFVMGHTHSPFLTRLRIEIVLDK